MSYFSGLIADRTKIIMIISTEPSLNGTCVCQLSSVASSTNTSHRFLSSSAFSPKISIARGEKSQPNIRKFASVLYLRIGKMVSPTPHPTSKILKCCSEHSFDAFNSGNSVNSHCRFLKNLFR